MLTHSANVEFLAMYASATFAVWVGLCALCNALWMYAYIGCVIPILVMGSTVCETFVVFKLWQCLNLYKPVLPRAPSIMTTPVALYAAKAALYVGHAHFMAAVSIIMLVNHHVSNKFEVDPKATLIYRGCNKAIKAWFHMIDLAQVACLALGFRKTYGARVHRHAAEPRRTDRAPGPPALARVDTSIKGAIDVSSRLLNTFTDMFVGSTMLPLPSTWPSAGVSAAGSGHPTPPSTMNESGYESDSSTVDAHSLQALHKDVLENSDRDAAEGRYPASPVSHPQPIPNFESDDDGVPVSPRHFNPDEDCDTFSISPPPS